MSLVDPVATYAVSTPDKEALVDLESGRRWTYAELNVAADRLAAWLVDRFGPGSGVRVAVLSKNRAETLILHWASIRAGTIFVPLNWRLAPPEIEALAADASPELLFNDSDFEPPDSAGHALPVSDMLELGLDGSSPPAESRRPFDQTATLLYTSGTSGRPKGVQLSEANAFWGCANFIYGNDVTVHSVFLCDMPLFHTAGLFAASRVPIQAGATVLVSRGFDTARTFERLSSETLNISHYFSVPQMASWIWNEAGFEPGRLQKLVCWAIGGAPNPKASTVRFAEAGIKVAEGFGMSEVGSAFGMPVHDLDVILRKAGSCGLPFMSLETRIVGTDGKDLPVGEVGELWLRGPSIASGYWNQPEATAAAFSDGWFRTGDAACRDEDGFFYVVDRMKDMFISGGENVYPAEIEALIAELPEVIESAVVGVDDERWGEVGRAYVIPGPGASVTPEQVLEHCQQRVAKYKVPKTVVITDSLPRTASGKLQKHILREQAAREMAPG